jgi:hypothetical protein
MSPESVIGSIRSALSLSSLRSGTDSRGVYPAQTYPAKLRDGDTQHDSFALRQPSSEEVAMDIELGKLETVPNSIRVTKRYETTVVGR